MATNVTIELDAASLRAVERALRAQGEDLLRALRQVVAEFTIRVQAEAKLALERDPRRIDEGTLRDSIQTAFEELAGYVFTRLGYAPYVHFGTGVYAEDRRGRRTPWVYFDARLQRFVTTRGMAANPFLARALDEVYHEFVAALERAIRSSIRRT